MAKTIKTLGDSPSKQEEVGFLEQITASIPPESYLSELFSKGFVLWATTSIRDDAAMDIYAFWQSEQARHRTCREDYETLLKENSSLKHSAQVADTTIANLIKQSQDYKDQNAALLTQNDQLVCLIDAAQKDIVAEREHSEGRLKEMLALKELLIAVISNTGGENARTTAYMLVEAWKAGQG